MSDMDLKTRVENLPCGTCEDMMNCDDCYHQKEAKDLYKQIRAEVYDECKYNAELFREIFLEDLIQQSVDREEAMMYRNICEMAWNKYLEHLKEKQNANRNRCDYFQERYQQGRSDGYSQAEKDYFANSQKDREDTYNCGYAIGRADAIDEFDSICEEARNHKFGVCDADFVVDVIKAKVKEQLKNR